jgi:hypothetical protein
MAYSQMPIPCTGGGHGRSTEEQVGQGVQQQQSSISWSYDVQQYHPKFSLPDLVTKLSIVFLILLLISVRKCFAGWNSVTNNHILVQITCCSDTLIFIAEHKAHISHLHNCVLHSKLSSIIFKCESRGYCGQSLAA